jgi:hypothetical protein
MHAKPFIPAYLEVRTEHGSDFFELSRILREPDLQDLCLEKRELRRIMKIIQGAKAAAAPGSGQSGNRDEFS